MPPPAFSAYARRANDGGEQIVVRRAIAAQRAPFFEKEGQMNRNILEDSIDAT